MATRMYEYTDVIIRYLNKRFIEVFHRLKSLVSFDELNVLQSTRLIYDELMQITEEKLLELAVYYYNGTVKNPKTNIDREWLYLILDDYDPITKYVFIHEVERKRARLAESILASQNKSKEIDAALRYWSAMVAQYAIEVTDEAVKQAYVDDGVEMVMWVSMLDDRRCKECEKREGKVYDISNVPPKPHIGCRCYLVPWFEEEQ